MKSSVTQESPLSTLVCYIHELFTSEHFHFTHMPKSNLNWSKKKKNFPVMESKTYLDSHGWICSLVEPAWSLEEVHWYQWNVQQSKQDFPVDREYPFKKILYIKK